jgi:NAD(P)H-flavin reductase
MEVLLMACGTGLAPIAAAIESNTLGLKEKNYNALYERKGLLYIGAKTPAHLPFQKKYKEWQDKGITVIPVLSQPPPDWKGRTGYIQDALREDSAKTPRNTGALLCGHRYNIYIR